MDRYQEKLAQREADGLLRKLPHVTTGIDLFSNDYLGLAQRTLSVEARAGSSGSRLLSGNSEQAEALERVVANFHQADAALVFNAGYSANTGLLSCLAERNDTYLLDELAHASLIDGARLSSAKRLKFKHNDLADLRKKLAHATGKKRIVVESIYSMNGEFAPLAALIELAEEHNAELIVDEAHSMGLYGENGEGYCQALGLHKEVFARIVTFGKAVGASGAAVLGASWLIDFLINFSRPFIYSTAPPPFQLNAIGSAYEQLPKMHSERDQLQQLIAYFTTQRPALTNTRWLPSTTMIQSCIIPGNEHVTIAAQALHEAGINVLPIRSPSVAAGTERLRICLHAFNTEKELDLLFKTLVSWNQNES